MNAATLVDSSSTGSESGATNIEPTNARFTRNQDTFNEYDDMMMMMGNHNTTTEIMVQKLLTELILFNEWGLSLDSDFGIWCQCRLREHLSSSCNTKNHSQSHCTSLHPGQALGLACQRTFLVLHKGVHLRCIDQIASIDELNHHHNGHDDINLDQNDFPILHETTISVPSNIIRFLLQDFGIDASLYRNPNTGRTALHEAVDSVSRNTNASTGANGAGSPTGQKHASALEVIQILIEHSPQLVHIADDYGVLPVDLLAKIVVMKEESFKYVKKATSAMQQNQQSRNLNRRPLVAVAGAATTDQMFYSVVKQELMDSWECARIIVIAQCKGSSGPNTPMLHACLMADSVPLSLIEFALRRFGDEQLSQTNDQGNLPLHLVAGKKLNANNDQINSAMEDEEANDDEDDDDEDDVGETYFFLLKDIVKRYPNAARVANHQGLIPLDLAIAAGRRWDTGIGCLLDIYPKGLADNLCQRNIPFEHFPVILSELLSTSTSSSARPYCISVGYAILQANPDLMT